MAQTLTHSTAGVDKIVIEGWPFGPAVSYTSSKPAGLEIHCPQRNGEQWSLSQKGSVLTCSSNATATVKATLPTGGDVVSVTLPKGSKIVVTSR